MRQRHEVDKMVREAMTESTDEDLAVVYADRLEEQSGADEIVREARKRRGLPVSEEED